MLKLACLTKQTVQKYLAAKTNDYDREQPQLQTMYRHTQGTTRKRHNTESHTTANAY